MTGNNNINLSILCFNVGTIVCIYFVGDSVNIQVLLCTVIV